MKVASTDSSERDVVTSDDSNMIPDVKPLPEETEEKKEKVEEKPVVVPTDDIYEFKEPEPFEFETRSKLVDDKALKKRLTPRLFEDPDKSPKKKGPKSPAKPETPEKRNRRTPVKKEEESDEEEKKIEDPFDKLVESPNFRVVKSAEKASENRPKVIRSINLDEPLNLFKDIEEDVESTCVERLDISDNDESQSQPLFSSNEDNIFSDTFVKTVSECSSLNQECLGFRDERKKDSDDDETLRLKDTIQRITQSTMTDEESGDGLLVKKKEVVEMKFTAFGLLEKDDSTSTEATMKEPPKMISPALQETDANLLKSIYEPQPELLVTKLDETKDIGLKTGAKVAESILQKFSMLKNQQQSGSESKPEVAETKTEMKEESVDLKVKSKLETKAKKPAKPVEPKSKPQPALSKLEKRNRKYVSPEFVESDSDSSDSGQLVIARSDEDSQMNLSQDKPDLKESDSNISFLHQAATDESQSQDEERNFKFSKAPSPPSETIADAKPDPPEAAREEEPDSNIHSLLLCKETIPGSPAPAAEAAEPVAPPPADRPRSKSLMEMPFASAPSSSNSKNVSVSGAAKEKVVQQVPFVLQPENRESREMNTVLDNTPPTTPESSISNLSPRG